jgi:uncharacterized protein with beta-barrel porin domain
MSLRLPFSLRPSARNSLSLILALSAAAFSVRPVVAATVTISTARTTPLDTATADGGAPGDVTIAAGGSIAVASGTALTINSNSAVINQGAITVADSANSIGVDIVPGFSGSFLNSNTITLSGPTAATVTDFSDDRAGILLAAGGTFNGNITQDTNGHITVTGDASSAIDLESALNGTLQTAGSVVIGGTNSFGIKVAGPVSGDVISGGTLIANGIGTRGLVVTGHIAGGLVNSATTTATAYSHLAQDRTVGSTNYNATEAAKQGGSAIAIGASVDEGFLNNGPDEAEVAAVTAGTFTGTATPTGVVTTYGGAPAVLLSPTVSLGAPSNINLGLVGTGENAFSFINRGQLIESGIYDGITVRTLRIEGATIGGTDYTATLSGGIRNEKTISAISSEAPSTAISIGALANMPAIINRRGGVVSALTAGATNVSASAIVIDPGAQIASITNLGSITATLNGPLGSAYGIVDNSGTLTSIDNRGKITPSLGSRIGAADTPTGQTVAIDVSSNTTGVTLNNNLPDDFNTATDTASNFAQIFGDIKFGSGADTFTMRNGVYAGNVTFGAGNDILNISGGAVVANVDFATGADQFVMTGGGFRGTLADAAGGLGIAVSSSALQLTSTGVLNISGATFGAGGIYEPTIDGSAGTATKLVASGPVAFQAGSTILITIPHAFANDFTTTLVSTPALTVAPGLQDLLSNSNPYLYNATLQRASAGGIDNLNLTLTRKTAAELGLPAAMVPIYEPLMQSLPHDDALGVAVVNLPTQASFLAAFTQFVPAFSDAPLAMARQSSDSYARIIRSRVVRLLTEQRGGGGWANELISTLGRNSSPSGIDYQSQGLMAAFGLDDYLGSSTILGLSFGLDQGSFTEHRVKLDPYSVQRYMGAFYIGTRFGPLVLTSSASAGYDRFQSDRTVIAGGQTRTALGRWRGHQYTADIAATYAAELGPLLLKPEIGVNYLNLFEDGHREYNGFNPADRTDAFDLSFASRKQEALVSLAELVIGLARSAKASAENESAVMRIFPEMRLGWSHDSMSDPSATTAQFFGGSSQFTLTSDPRETEGLSAGLGFSAISSYVDLRVTLDAHFNGKETAYTGGLHLGIAF